MKQTAKAIATVFKMSPIIKNFEIKKNNYAAMLTKNALRLWLHWLTLYCNYSKNMQKLSHAAPNVSAKKKMVYNRIGLDSQTILLLQNEAETLGISGWANLRRIVGEYFVTKNNYSKKTF